jgi:hypothetical protein
MPTDGSIFPPQSIPRTRRSHPTPQGRAGSMLLSAPVGLMAAAVILVIMMGCMSLSIGNRTVETLPVEESVLCQQGEAHVAANSSMFVHYPLPYPRKPNLEISCTFDDCPLVREEVDGFLLKNPNCLGRTVTWKARGPRCEPPPVAPPPMPAPALAPVPAGSPSITLPAPTPERGPGG